MYLEYLDLMSKIPCNSHVLKVLNKKLVMYMLYKMITITFLWNNNCKGKSYEPNEVKWIANYAYKHTMINFYMHQISLTTKAKTRHFRTTFCMWTTTYLFWWYVGPIIVCTCSSWVMMRTFWNFECDIMYHEKPETSKIIIYVYSGSLYAWKIKTNSWTENKFALMWYAIFFLNLELCILCQMLSIVIWRIE